MASGFELGWGVSAECAGSECAVERAGWRLGPKRADKVERWREGMSGWLLAEWESDDGDDDDDYGMMMMMMMNLGWG